MSTRLQVVMTDEELAEIRDTAKARRMSVSHWVRLVLREERERVRRGRAGAVREATETYVAGSEELPPRVRVELDLKSDLLDAVQERYHLSSRRAAVEFALRRLAVTPMSKDEVLAMQGTGWEGDLDAARAGDPGDLW